MKTMADPSAYATSIEVAILAKDTNAKIDKLREQIRDLKAEIRRLKGLPPEGTGRK